MNALDSLFDLVIAGLIWLIDGNPFLDFIYAPLAWLLLLLGG